MPRTRKRAGPGHFYSFMAHNCRASFHLAQAVHNCGSLRAGKLSFGQKRAVRALQNTLEADSKITKLLIIGGALAEATAVYGLVIGLLIILLLK